MPSCDKYYLQTNDQMPEEIFERYFKRQAESWQIHGSMHNSITISVG